MAIYDLNGKPAPRYTAEEKAQHRAEQQASIEQAAKRYRFRRKADQAVGLAAQADEAMDMERIPAARGYLGDALQAQSELIGLADLDNDAQVEVLNTVRAYVSLVQERAYAIYLAN